MRKRLPARNRRALVRIAFLSPPAAKTTGGLIAAIRDLRAGLEAQGVTVTDTLRPAPDIAHFHGLWEFSFQAAARHCREAGIPYVVSPHGMLEPWAYRHKFWKKAPYFRLLERPFLARSAALLATSPGEARNLTARFPGANVQTIPLGLADDVRPDYEGARRQLGWHSDETILLYLSRIDQKKGLDLLLHAMARHPRPHTRLVIVGGGDSRYLQQLQTLQRRLGLLNVEWTGEIWGADRWRYFQGADLFCLPSHSENFGLAALESYWAGTPVLTTHATPWPELAGHGRGYFTTPDVAGTAAALRAFHADGRWPKEQREALAAWARATFHRDRLSADCIRMYKTVRTQAA